MNGRTGIRLPALGAVLAGALALSACTAASTPVPPVTTPSGTLSPTVPAAASPSATSTACSDGLGPEVSFQPRIPLGRPGDVSAWPSVAAIKNRPTHRLIVGVASD